MTHPVTRALVSELHLVFIRVAVYAHRYSWSLWQEVDLEERVFLDMWFWLWSITVMVQRAREYYSPLLFSHLTMILSISSILTEEGGLMATRCLINHVTSSVARGGQDLYHRCRSCTTIISRMMHVFSHSRTLPRERSKVGFYWSSLSYDDQQEYNF